MSRIGKIPVKLAKGVDVTISDAEVVIKGSKGEVRVHRLAGVKVEREGDELKFIQTEETREANANTGTMRALVNDMVKGVSVGFEKKLTLVGVGYRAQAQAMLRICNLVSRILLCTRCPRESHARPQVRQKSSLAVPTSKSLARQQRLSAVIVRPNPTRARESAMPMSMS